jgi:hypothetical protein
VPVTLADAQRRISGSPPSGRAAALWALGILVAASLAASGPAGRWVDPPAAPNSLAREAVRKLVTSIGERDDLLALNDGGTYEGAYIVIDTHTNRLYWRTAERVLLEMLCSTGTGAELGDPDGVRRWRFDTPRGIFAVSAMAPDPVWRRPDWVFIEEGAPIPDSVEARLDAEALGDYAIAFGDGYYIHGTIYDRLIGVAVTHGCVRLAADDLERLYGRVSIGTPVVIF